MFTATIGMRLYIIYYIIQFIVHSRGRNGSLAEPSRRSPESENLSYYHDPNLLYLMVKTLQSGVNLLTIYPFFYLSASHRYDNV